MPRPDRRTRRAAAGALVTITALALIWPASFVSGKTPSSDSSTSTAGNAAKAAREPAIHGLGSQPLKGNGEKRTKPLQKLAVDHENRGNGNAGGTQAPDTQSDLAAAPESVQVTPSGAPSATSFGAWEGINQATSGFEPPDPWVAVGPNDVVQSVNTRIRFTNREGGSTASDVEVFDFFAFDELMPGDPNFITGVGDPRFVYDAKHNRWLGITLAWHCDTDGAGTADARWATSRARSAGPATRQATITSSTPVQHVPARLPRSRHVRRQVRDHGQRVRPERRCRLHIRHPLRRGSVMSFDWAGMMLEPSLPDGDSSSTTAGSHCDPPSCRRARPTRCS